jgi:hypothetical protein
MAILIEEDNSESLVFESTFASGVRIVPYKKWLEINEECYKIICLEEKTNKEIFQYVNEYWGKKYDWRGVCFFIPCFVANLLFKVPFPKTNAWQSDDKYFCNELGGKIAGYPKYSMTTPAKMCSDFLNK